jgi:hypothetical protein
MAGYVLTPVVLGRVRALAMHAFDATGWRLEAGDARRLAMELLADIEKADGLDPDKVREVAEHARKQANSFDPSSVLGADARREWMAEMARIVVLCAGILLALSFSSIPDKAVQVVRDPEPTWVAGGKLADVKSARPESVIVGVAANDPDSELARTKAQADRLADELAEARKALGDIAEICNGDEVFWIRPADVVTMVDGLDDRAGAPRWSVPDDHPLATHDWESWLGTLLDAERRAQAAGVRFDDEGERARSLRQALERVEARDSDGLRGLADRLRRALVNRGGLWVGELDLISWASGDFRAHVRVDINDGALVCMEHHRVPRRAKP